MPVFPESPSPCIDILAEINTTGFDERWLAFSTHTGTHVDAPAHMLREAPDLSHLPLDHFYGRATMLPLMIGDALQISLTDLKPHGRNLAKAEFLLLQTGWSQYWGQTIYFKQFPVLDADAVRWLCDLGLKGVGIDTPSLDRSDSNDYPIHKAFLGRSILLIENLTNLNQLPQDLFTLVCFPLPVQQADGSPVRAVAIID
jgi:kynurenine formamidase